MTRESNIEPAETRTAPPPAWVFDIDGTLIAETPSDDDNDDIRIRPGVIELLQWLHHDRKYPLAIWTAGGPDHAQRVVQKLCPLVQQQQDDDDDHHHHHTCDGGRTCRRTFAFVWDGSLLRQANSTPNMYFDYDLDTCCRWCQPYRRVCSRCACVSMSAPAYCPCRYTKDLQKVWKQHAPVFTRERTLMVENTPQQCIGNYGNAIYVPTYTGGAAEEEDFRFLGRFQRLALEIEAAKDVRQVVKCRHRKGPHACFEQLWWNYDEPLFAE